MRVAHTRPLQERYSFRFSSIRASTSFMRASYATWAGKAGRFEAGRGHRAAGCGDGQEDRWAPAVKREPWPDTIPKAYGREEGRYRHSWAKMSAVADATQRQAPRKQQGGKPMTVPGMTEAEVLVSQLPEIVRTSIASDPHATISIALDVPGSGGFVAGTLAFHVGYRKPRPEVLYPDELRLIEDCVPSDSAIRMLRSFLAGGTLIANRTIREKAAGVGSQGHNYLIRHSRTGWGEFVATLGMRGTANRSSTHPFIQCGQMPARSRAHAVANWVSSGRQLLSLGHRSNISIPDEGSLTLVVPDGRARIKTALWTRGFVDFSVERDERSTEFEAHAIFGTHAGDKPAIHARFEGAGRFEVPMDATSVDLYLVHDKFMLCQVDLTLASPAYGELPGGKGEFDAIGTILANGENEQVEFKPFVEAGDTKFAEILRTVVAFANGLGGTIAIGVNSEGGLEGIGALRACVEKNGRSGPDLQERLARIYDAKIRDCIEPVPPLRCVPVTHHGSPLVVIKVEPRQKSIYSIAADRGVWIRRGASNRRPDPQLELEGFFRSPFG